jgi:antitoxin component of MazEF toxin-antitoxin module
MVKSLHVQEGEQIELAIRGDRVELRSARPRYRLEELVRRMSPDDQPEPIDLPPVGEELL